MADIIEKNIDIPMWAHHEGEKTEYKNLLAGKEIGDVDTAQERHEADEIIKQLQWPEKQLPTAPNQQNTSVAPEISSVIEKLNRPEAEKGIAKSYANIDTAIKNSKNEKGIAGFFGKILNWINP